MGDRVEAVRYAEEALEIGRSLGDDRLIGNALGFLGLAVVSGRAKKKRLLTEAVAHLRRAGDLCRLLLVAHQPGCHSSWPMRTRKRPPNCSRRTLPSARSSTCLVELVPACCVLADTTLFEGRFEDAAGWLRRALVFYRRQGLQDSAVADFPNVVCCVARLGNPGDAARLTGAYNAMLSRHVPLESTFTEENPLAHLEFLRQTRLEQTLVYMREALGDDNFELLQPCRGQAQLRRGRRPRPASDPG